MRRSLDEGRAILHGVREALKRDAVYTTLDRLVPLATMVVLFLKLGLRAGRWLWVGALALLGVAVRGLVHEMGATHFEGFVLLISLALVLQSVFMLSFLGRGGPRRLARGAGGSH